MTANASLVRQDRTANRVNQDSGHMRERWELVLSVQLAAIESLPHPCLVNSATVLNVRIPLLGAKQVLLQFMNVDARLVSFPL